MGKGILNPNYGYGQYITPGIIAHEAVHAKNMLFDDVNIVCDLINDEPEAYMVEWFTDQASEFYKEVTR